MAKTRKLASIVAEFGGGDMRSLLAQLNPDGTVANPPDKVTLWYQEDAKGEIAVLGKGATWKEHVVVPIVAREILRDAGQFYTAKSPEATPAEPEPAKAEAPPEEPKTDTKEKGAAVDKAAASEATPPRRRRRRAASKSA